MPADWAHERVVSLIFEGVFRSTTVWLNGVRLPDGEHQFGYTSFAVRLDNVTGVKFGDGKAKENVLAVHVNAMKGTGWWYEGGGIYRHCQLVATPPLHFARDGLFVRTGAVNATHATVKADAELTNAAGADVTVLLDIRDASGSVVASASASVSALNGSTSAFASAMLVIASPERWSVQRPYL